MKRPDWSLDMASLPSSKEYGTLLEGLKDTSADATTGTKVVDQTPALAPVKCESQRDPANATETDRKLLKPLSFKGSPFF